LLSLLDSISSMIKWCYSYLIWILRRYVIDFQSKTFNIMITRYLSIEFTSSISEDFYLALRWFGFSSYNWLGLGKLLYIYIT
jgi:hypothetical protein